MGVVGFVGFVGFLDDESTKDVYGCCVVQPVGLGKIAKHINAGQIDSHELIKMKTLKVWSWCCG